MRTVLASRLFRLNNVNIVERHDHFNTSYYGVGDVEDGDIWGTSATLPAIYRRNGAARRQTRGSIVLRMHVLPNRRPERSPFCLPSEIRVSGTETNVFRLLHKQTCPANTLYGHTIPPLNYRARESHSSRFPWAPVFMNFKELSWSPAKFGLEYQMSRISPSHKNTTFSATLLNPTESRVLPTYSNGCYRQHFH